MMVRKQILLDEKHNNIAKRFAKQLNESESEVIRRALEAYDPALADQKAELEVLAEILKESTKRADKAVTHAIKEVDNILDDYRANKNKNKKKRKGK